MEKGMFSFLSSFFSTMAKKTIDTILICALPASGKSETRKYLETLSPEECEKNFHLGHTVQLDDYPYVHFMRCVDEEYLKLGHGNVFFQSLDKGFKNGHDWGTLIHLLNEDYDDLVHKNKPSPKDVSMWLFDRIDKARGKMDQDAVFKDLKDLKKLAKKLEPEAVTILKNKNNGIPETLDGKTVVVEFARGGKHGSKFPLPAPFGYQYSFSQLSDAILEKAAVLYVWVTPEGSRKKNLERARPDGQGSILFHGVPEWVMMNDYGCDDIEHLLSVSDRPDTVKVKGFSGHEFYVPLGRFDNRDDLTSFARVPVEEWKKKDTNKIRKGMEKAFDGLITQYEELHGGKRRKK